jgi:hypothetical protein
MSDTDFTLLINRMQTLHRAISGIRYAPPLHQYPTALQTPSLPSVLTWIGPGQFSTKGGGWYWDVRTALVLLYVEPLGQNDIPSRAVEAVRLLAALRETYINVANIPLAYPGDNTGGYQLTFESSPETPHTDEGIVPNLSYGGAAYYGARLRVTVTMQWGQ